MSKKVLVVAPHPDDETLGCGGTLLRHAAEGDEIYWLISTKIMAGEIFSEDRVRQREYEIQKVSENYGFNALFNLGFPTTRLDTVAVGDIVKKISDIFFDVCPEEIYVPYRGDIHSDHSIVFDAVVACTKWFRHPSVKRVLAYETISETDFGINPNDNGFRPNVFVDISNYLDTKINILELYLGEVGEFPFPRSEEAIRALAALRGVSSGFKAAEAFMLLKEII